MSAAVATPVAVTAATPGSVARSLGRRALSALSFFGWLYLSTAVFMGAWILGTSALLGWKPVLVTSNSMSPSIRAGDVMMVGAMPPGSLGEQSVILFADPLVPGKRLTHRIVTANEDGTYQTQGDANRDADTAPVSRAQIQGVGRMVIPAIGKPAVWLNEGHIAYLILWAVASGLAGAFAFWRPNRKRKATA